MLRRFSTFLACALIAACGAKAKTPAPVDTLCADGTSICIGNVSAACAAGGKSYDLTQCGVDKFCNATTGKCEATVCEKGSSKCVGTDSIECSADGSVATTNSCTSKQKCQAGICVATGCAGTQQKCGWNAVLNCSSNAWAQTDCATGEMCDPTTLKCVARACDGSYTQCKDDSTAAHCSDSGDAWVLEPCGAGNGCFDGVCHALVSGSTVDDTSTGSDDGTTAADVGKDGKTTLELPPEDIQLDAPDLFEVIVSSAATPPDGTQPTVFSNASAVWLPALNTLQISGAQDAIKVEIDVAPITELQTGTFTAANAAAAGSKIGYDDGTGVVTAGQFQYTANDYTIELDAFGAVGDRIQGSFSGQLVDANGNNIWLIDGKFDIKR